MSDSRGAGRRALVTGVTGYIGSRLVPALLDEGWTVRVLTRDAAKLDRRLWRERAEVVEGDATSRATLAEALADVDVAYYLLHSMDGAGNFVERDREMARAFGLAAYEAEVGRLVYLSGLHPDDGPLSDHLASARRGRRPPHGQWRADRGAAGGDHPRVRLGVLRDAPPPHLAAAVMVAPSGSTTGSSRSPCATSCTTSSARPTCRPTSTARSTSAVPRC